MKIFDELENEFKDAIKPGSFIHETDLYESRKREDDLDGYEDDEDDDDDDDE